MQTSTFVFLSLILFSVHSFKFESKLKTIESTPVSFISITQNTTTCSSDAPAEGCVWLFTDYVTKIEVCANNPDLRGVSFDKVALAIQLGANTDVYLYDNYNYTGNQKFYNVSGYYQLLDFLCSVSSVGVASNRVKNYQIRGYIKNALTGVVFNSSTIASGNVQVIFTANGKNYSATINSANSTYSVSLPAATYTRWAVMDNMVQTTTTINVTSADSLETNEDNSVLFSSIIKGWRAVLSWATTQDLDTYILTPSKTKVYYKVKTSSDGTAVLDVDNRNGTGPETCTFNFDNATKSGSYKYYVNSYSKKNLNQSESKVVVYHGNGQVAEVKPPSSANNTYWYVFKIDVVKGGSETFSLVNNYTSTIS